MAHTSSFSIAPTVPGVSGQLRRHCDCAEPIPLSLGVCGRCCGRLPVAFPDTSRQLSGNPEDTR